MKLELQTSGFSKIRGTYFCFTDFKNSRIDYAKIYFRNKDKIRFLYTGTEICPSTGKFHQQSYIQMFVQCRATAIQDMFDCKFHIEKCRGSPEENVGYCGKDEDIRMWGKMSKGQGHRSDLDSIKDDLKEGADLYEIMDNYTSNFIRYYGGIMKMKSLIDKKQRRVWRDIEVTSLTGKAGEGKSSHVYKKHGYENVFTIDQKMMKTDFWGSYDGEKVLLIDDFNGWIQYAYLLRILDGHPLHINIKNGNTFANWDKVYITSNVKPGEWYSRPGENLRRRFHKCLEVRQGNTINLSQPWESKGADEYGGCVLDFD